MTDPIETPGKGPGFLYITAGVGLLFGGMEIAAWALGYVRPLVCLGVLAIIGGVVAYRLATAQWAKEPSK